MKLAVLLLCMVQYVSSVVVDPANSGASIYAEQRVDRYCAGDNWETDYNNHIANLTTAQCKSRCDDDSNCKGFSIRTSPYSFAIQTSGTPSTAVSEEDCKEAHRLLGATGTSFFANGAWLGCRVGTSVGSASYGNYYYNGNGVSSDCGANELDCIKKIFTDTTHCVLCTSPVITWTANHHSYTSYQAYGTSNDGKRYILGNKDNIYSGKYEGLACEGNKYNQEYTLNPSFSFSGNRTDYNLDLLTLEQCQARCNNRPDCIAITMDSAPNHNNRCILCTSTEYWWNYYSGYNTWYRTQAATDPTFEDAPAVASPSELNTAWSGISCAPVTVTVGSGVPDLSVSETECKQYADTTPNTTWQYVYQLTQSGVPDPLMNPGACADYGRSINGWQRSLSFGTGVPTGCIESSGKIYYNTNSGYNSCSSSYARWAKCVKYGTFNDANHPKGCILLNNQDVYYNHGGANDCSVHSNSTCVGKVVHPSNYMVAKTYQKGPGNCTDGLICFTNGDVLECPSGMLRLNETHCSSRKEDIRTALQQSSCPL